MVYIVLYHILGITFWIFCCVFPATYQSHAKIFLCCNLISVHLSTVGTKLCDSFVFSQYSRVKILGLTWVVFPSVGQLITFVAWVDLLLVGWPKWWIKLAMGVYFWQLQVSRTLTPMIVFLLLGKSFHKLINYMQSCP